MENNNFFLRFPKKITPLKPLSHKPPRAGQKKNEKKTKKFLKRVDTK